MEDIKNYLARLSIAAVVEALKPKCESPTVLNEAIVKIFKEDNSALMVYMTLTYNPLGTKLPTIRNIKDISELDNFFPMYYNIRTTGTSGSFENEINYLVSHIYEHKSKNFNFRTFS